MPHCAVWIYKAAEKISIYPLWSAVCCRYLCTEFDWKAADSALWWKFTLVHSKSRGCVRSVLSNRELLVLERIKFAPPLCAQKILKASIVATLITQWRRIFTSPSVPNVLMWEHCNTHHFNCAPLWSTVTPQWGDSELSMRLLSHPVCMFSSDYGPSFVL